MSCTISTATASPAPCGQGADLGGDPGGTTRAAAQEQGEPHRLIRAAQRLVRMPSARACWCALGGEQAVGMPARVWGSRPTRPRGIRWRAAAAAGDPDRHPRRRRCGTPTRTPPRCCGPAPPGHAHLGDVHQGDPPRTGGGCSGGTTLARSRTQRTVPSRRRRRYRIDQPTAAPAARAPAPPAHGRRLDGLLQQLGTGAELLAAPAVRVSTRRLT